MISDEGMVVRSAPIDSLGRFELSGREFSDGEYLCRLRFIQAGGAEFSIYVNQRHYLTFVTTGRDTLLTTGLRLEEGNAASRAINELELRLDELNPRLSATQTDRGEEMVDRGRLELLTGAVTNLPDPYARIVALGHLDEPTGEDLRHAAQALGATSLPLSFVQAVERLLAAEDYDRVNQENGYLRIIAGVLLFLLAAVVLSRFQRKVVPEPEEPSSAPPPVKDFGLTDKESEVMALIAAGLSNREIADRLFVAETTVKTHINNIYKKLGVKGRKAAVETWGQEDSTPD